MTRAEHEAALKRYAGELLAILAKSMATLENEFGAQELIAEIRGLADRMRFGGNADCRRTPG